MKNIVKKVIGILVTAGVTAGILQAAVKVNGSEFPFQNVKGREIESKESFTDIFKEWNNLTDEKLFLKTAEETGRTYKDSDKVWKGTDFSRYGSVIIQSENENAYFITPEGRITSIKKSDLGNKITKTLFFTDASKNKVNGIQTSVLKVDNNLTKDNTTLDWHYKSLPELTFIYNMIIHEEFHAYQSNWKVIADQEGLEKEFPKNKEARIIRAHLFEALKAAVIDPENKDTHLSHAKYWLEKYANEFTKEKELAVSMDIIEGSAKYFDLAMSVRAKTGMDANKEEIFKTYRELLKTDILSDRFDGRPDTESYYIGAAACMLLEESSLDDWQTRIENGETPADVLLENITAKPQDENKDLTQKIIKNSKSW